MTAERWARIQELFQLALECEPQRRAACLEAACAGDESLRREVESLLSSEPRAHDHLNAAINAAMDAYSQASTLSSAPTASIASPATVLEEQDFAGTQRFSIQRRLGAGGFGTVYQAYDNEQNTVVALKTLRHLDAQSLVEFKREFRALADISHPNLVTLYELISDGEQCFFTMELVEGLNFREFAGDRVRLREVVKQLAQGVSALHAAGKLHRDLKPSNVLVTTEGRLVILDFGLITDTITHDPHDSLRIAGTPGYMSPEQRVGLPLTEASDWYSVGIMMYEALMGHLPSKTEPDPAADPELMSSVPQDLSDLCMGLLHRDPRSRPSGAEVRRRLGIRAADLAGIAQRNAPFVGREDHLRALAGALESTKTGRAVAVYIHGGSGVGKTALAQRFLQGIQRTDDVVVLTGRCYDRESVPYKAIDSLVDALSAYLRKFPQERLYELMPDMSVLARMFPVLRGLAAADGVAGDQSAADPQEQRRRGFAALRELLARLARRRPVILFIDDLQWGDSDSAGLIAELLRPPDAPALLMIGCYRTEDAGYSPFLQTLSSLQAGTSTGSPAHLELTDLTPAEARELAVSLLGAAEVAPSVGADGVARHSGGNPFFISELARYAKSQRELPQPISMDAPTLDDLVKVRLSALPEPARRFLELITVAGQPLEFSTARRAFEGLADDSAALAVLRAGRMIRVRSTKHGHEIETYHDRIRETVAAGLPAGTSRDLHGRVARALETAERSVPEQVAIHYAAAGCNQEARLYAIQAADQASAALAFDSAARFYRMAIDLLPADSGRLALQRKLGDALSSAGRGAEAAEAYLTAAELEGSAMEALEDRRNAARQYLISGRIDEGRTVIQALLNAIGMKLAQTPRRALISMLLGRARINLSRLRYQERAAGESTPADLIRIDTCWSVAQGLGFVDTIHAADFQARHILLALRAGDRYRVARALAIEAAYHALAGGRRSARTSQALQAAAELSRRCDDPHALAFTTLIEGMCAFLEGRWKSAQQQLARAETILLDRCIGAAWELATARLMWCASSFFLGELAELGRRLPSFLADADARGDLYQATALRTRIGHAGPLAADEPGQARPIVSGAIAKWSVQGFHTQHWWNLIAQSEISLYQDRGLDAWESMTRDWPAVKRAMLLRIQYILIESLCHRASSALAAAADSRSNAARRKALLHAADRDAASMDGEKVPWARALAGLIRAGSAATLGNHEAAANLCQSAEAALESTDMRLYAAVARRRRGQLIRGDEGDALMRSADLWMTGQGIRNPERMTRMLAPGAWGAH